MNINVCISCDNNYSIYAGVVIASILANAMESDVLHFYILDGNIDSENKAKILSLKSIKDCEITFVPVKEDDFNLYRDIVTHDYVSIATYYRLRLGALLPDVDKIIYLDCDTVVNTSLAELYDTNLENHYIAGVLDARVKHKKKWANTNYINGGVLVIDLKKVRNDDIEEKYYEYTKNNPDVIKTGDQDIINFVLKDKIKILSDEWNVQISNFNNRTSYTRHPKIIHYIGRQKPWLFGAVTFFKSCYFKNLQLTPWAIPADDSKENFKWKFLNPLYTGWRFFKNRPLFFIRPKFWRAFYYTFIKKS